MENKDSKEKVENDEENIKQRIELPYLFEKEIYIKQCKKTYVLDEFIPTEKVIPIASKFYSRFNNKNLGINKLKVLHLADTLHKLPVEKYPVPILESHSYGWPWFTEKGYYKINRIIAPKIRCELTIYGEKRFCESITERPVFNGEKFYLR